MKTTVLKSSITLVELTAVPGSSTFSFTIAVKEATGLSASAVTSTVTVSVAPKLSVTVNETTVEAPENVESNVTSVLSPPQSYAEIPTTDIDPEAEKLIAPPSVTT